MKKKLYFLLPILFIGIVACNKDQKLTNRADGEWEIEQITFTDNGKDSVVMNPVGVFSFEK